MAVRTPERPAQRLRADIHASHDGHKALPSLMPRTCDERRTFPREMISEAHVIEHYLREGRFQRGLALVAGMSGLLGGLEVAYEHYRGSYGQRVMYSPVVLSAALAGAGALSAVSRRAARSALPLASWLLLGDGTLGFIFHIRGIQRKPGGWRIPVFNVIMGPPLFAPLLLGIGGFLGVIASFLRREDDPEYALPSSAAVGAAPHPLARVLPRRVTREEIAVERDLREARLQQLLGGAAAISALLNGLEALYSHYKTGYRYWAQYTPVVLSPFVIIAGVASIFSKRAAHTVLPVASALALLDGGIGFLYHVRGVARRPGRLSHWLYNVLYGPPIFAPLLYAATGFLGLLASFLRRA